MNLLCAIVTVIVAATPPVAGLLILRAAVIEYYDKGDWVPSDPWRHPDPVLLEAMHEVDALTPSVEPIAPAWSRVVPPEAAKIYLPPLIGPTGIQGSDGPTGPTGRSTFIVGGVTYFLTGEDTL